MKILVEIEPSYDNEIGFYDACMAASRTLKALAIKALDDGDADQFIGTSHDVVEENDEETIGTVTVMS